MKLPVATFSNLWMCGRYTSATGSAVAPNDIPMMTWRKFGASNHALALSAGWSISQRSLLFPGATATTVMTVASPSSAR